MAIRTIKTTSISEILRKAAILPTLIISVSACAASSGTLSDTPDMQDMYDALLGPSGKTGLRLAGDVEDLGEGRFRIDFSPGQSAPNAIRVPDELINDVMEVQAFVQLAHRIGDFPTRQRAFDVIAREGSRATLLMTIDLPDHLPAPKPFIRADGGLMGSHMVKAYILKPQSGPVEISLNDCPDGSQATPLLVGYGTKYDDHVHFAVSYETDVRADIGACKNTLGEWEFTLASIAVADPRVSPAFHGEQ